MVEDRLADSGHVAAKEVSSWAEFVQGASNSRIYLAVQRDLSLKERELLLKILKAVGEDSLTLLRIPESVESWQSASSLGLKSVLVFSDLVSPALVGEIKKGQANIFGKTSVLLTAELSGMLAGSAEEVQNHKRIVWSDIQPLKV